MTNPVEVNADPFWASNTADFARFSGLAVLLTAIRASTRHTL